jgi:hypothetical protein
MESQNYKIIRNYLSKEEKDSILTYIESIKHHVSNANHHLNDIAKSLKGTSSIFDISNTNLTNYITKFQSISDVSLNKPPDLILNIQSRIAKDLKLSLDNTFLQAVDMYQGGSIKAHYDASIKGYINYKCNIPILTDDYNFYIDKDILSINEGDLYCFEASLFKHWTKEFNSRRVFLSFGFIIPYSDMGRNELDPRVRLSLRIEKYFQ